jgi:hypothetical protein
MSTPEAYVATTVTVLDLLGRDTVSSGFAARDLRTDQSQKVLGLHLLDSGWRVMVDRIV